METTHTNGVWRRTTDRGEHIAVLPDLDKNTNDGFAVAHCYGKDRLYNDALISAAPELLEQLKYLVALEESTAAEVDEPTPHLDAARAAIRKAEGAA